MKLDNLLKYHDFNPVTVMSVMYAEEPLVSLVMLSYQRRFRLIQSLKYITDTFDTPLNLCLQVQQSEPDSVVSGLARRFYDFNVSYTSKNRGTGAPRHETLHTALDEFNTPFILFTDDDMELPRYSIELMTSILIDNPEFGAVNMFTSPNSNVWKIRNGKLTSMKPQTMFEHEDVVSLGSATLVVRREVFENCDLDNRYRIGCADVDFGLQMNKQGWKLGMMNLPDYHARNLKGGCKAYRAVRHEKKVIENSQRLFRQKWGYTL